MSDFGLAVDCSESLLLNFNLVSTTTDWRLMR